MSCVLVCWVYYPHNITMTLIYCVYVALFVVHIRAWTVCSHFILGRTFYVTFFPVTVCECHTELKGT